MKPRRKHLLNAGATIAALCSLGPLQEARTAPTDATTDLVPPLVCLQPLGTPDRKLLRMAAAGATDLFGSTVRLLAPHPLPDEAYYAPRKRYRAERLLDWLDRTVPATTGCAYVVGFTTADISTTKDAIIDWGIFGLGTIGGRTCVVSTYRLGNAKHDTRLLAQRIIKVVNHELGHNLGLEHCPTTSCLMEDAAGTIKTVDRETGLLCDRCKARIEAVLRRPLPAHEHIDWDALIRGQ